MAQVQPSKHPILIAFVVLSVAVVGYFTGLQSPVKPPDESPIPGHAVHDAETTADIDTSLPATHYAEMAQATQARAAAWTTNLAMLKSDVDPLAEITIDPDEKQAALEARDQTRAFNGAPPTIPHPIDQRTDRACMECHGAGAKTSSLRIPRMSHQFLANCTQCHVESNPQHMPAALFCENDFDGLPAPLAGSRAYPGAPPVIPHSTWMRSNCMSCHGPTGLYGIRTTHPWRQSCQQCHAPSATMEQSQLSTDIQFLPPPEVESEPNSAGEPPTNGSTP